LDLQHLRRTSLARGRSIWVVVSFLLAACNDTFTTDEVSGEYVANYDLAFETLIVNRDGTYSYYFRSPDGTETSNAGQWKLEQHMGQPGLTFSSFKFGLPEYGTDRPGYWNVEIERTLFGRLKLCFDPDLGYCYIKS
jgi:hypothetical protein